MSINRLYHKSETSSNLIRQQTTLVDTWRPGLTAQAYAICMFIAQRTLRFDKEWEIIPDRHFLEGVFYQSGPRQGDLITAGLFMSKSTLWRHLQILTTPNANGSVAVERYLTYRDWNGQQHGHAVFKYRLNPNFKPAMRQPRAKKQASSEEALTTLQWYAHVAENQRGASIIQGQEIENAYQDEEPNINNDSQSGTVRVVNPTNYKQRTDETENKGSKDISTLTGADTVRALRIPRKGLLPLPITRMRSIDDAVAEPEESPVPPVADAQSLRKPEKVGTPLARAKKLWLALETEFVTNNTENRKLSPVLPWTMAQMGMMKELIRKWTEGGGDIEDFLEIIRDSLTNWIMVTKAMNINSAPQPALGLFVKCFTGFRDRKINVGLMQEKAGEYWEAVATHRAARLADKYQATGQLDPKDERQIVKEEKQLDKKARLSVGLNTERFKTARIQQQEAREAQRNRIAALVTNPPPAYDRDDDITVDPSLFIMPAFKHE